jgi:hypothetical protein
MVVIQDKEALVIVNKQHVFISGGSTGSNAEAANETACE